jgi:hypothetical protein
VECPDIPRITESYETLLARGSSKAMRSRLEGRRAMRRDIGRPKPALLGFLLLVSIAVLLDAGSCYSPEVAPKYNSPF